MFFESDRHAHGRSGVDAVRDIQYRCKFNLNKNRDASNTNECEKRHLLTAMNEHQAKAEICTFGILE